MYIRNRGTFVILLLSHCMKILSAPGHGAVYTFHCDAKVLRRDWCVTAVESPSRDSTDTRYSITPPFD